MGTLFELTTDMQALYALATEEDDEHAFLDTLEGLKGMIQDKAASYVDVIQQLDMEAAKADLMAKQFAQKRDIRKNNVKRMKEALMIAMDAMDATTMDAGNYTIKIVKNGGVQPLRITGEVPDNMTKVTVEPDGAKIREFLKDQPEHVCEWAFLEERGRHITIK